MPLTLLSEGIDIYDVETDKLDFSDDRIPEILEFNQYMFQKAMKMTTAENKFDAEFFWRSFSNGEILFLDTFSYSLMVIPENPPFDIMVQASDMSRFNCSASVPRVLGIGKACRELESAMRFIQFACGKTSQTMLAKSRSNIPAMHAVAESDLFLDNCPANMKSVLQNLYFPESVLTGMKIFDETKFMNLQLLIQDFLFGNLSLDKAVYALRHTDFSK
jgi:hypothetical protein